MLVGGMLEEGREERGKVERGRRKGEVPLDIFGVGAEVGCVVYLVFEELCGSVS